MGEKEPINGVGEVPSDLGHERLARERRRARDMDPSRLQVDHEQGVVGDQALGVQTSVVKKSVAATSPPLG